MLEVGGGILTDKTKRAKQKQQNVWSMDHMAELMLMLTQRGMAKGAALI